MLEGKRRAVIIGINEYKDKGFAPLAGAENDASDIYERLKDPSLGNFEVPDDHYLIGQKASSERIRKAISDVFWKTDSCDLALFYFSGHGFVDGYGDGYIAPYDMYKDEPFICGINMAELRQVISKSVNNCLIMILDCCYSGKGAKGEPDFKTQYEEHLKNLSGEGRFIWASSKENELAREATLKHENGQDSHPHGIFTFHLIEGLDGQASDESGIITLSKLQEHIEKQMQPEGKQKPIFSVTEATGMSLIKVAITPRRHNEYIIAKMEEAERFYANPHPSTVIKAVQTVHDVLDVAPKNEKALDLKKKIVGTLENYRQLTLYWLAINDKDIRGSIGNAFARVEKLVGDLDFERITRLNREESALLILAFRVSMEEGFSDKQFIERCKQFDNPAPK